MESFLPVPKAVLAALAATFAAAAVLYSSLWMYSIRWQSGVELGFDFDYIGTLHAERVRSVEPGGPAAKAGLKPGDRITAINEHPIEDRHMIFDVWSRQKPGNEVKLSVVREGEPSPLVMTATFRTRQYASKEARL